MGLIRGVIQGNSVENWTEGTRKVHSRICTNSTEWYLRDVDPKAAVDPGALDADKDPQVHTGPPGGPDLGGKGGGSGGEKGAYEGNVKFEWI